MAPLQKILVLGGNGFIGSAVCRFALAKGMQVTSVSSSGKPYRTPKGHAPDWTSKVDWQKGDALHPETFAHLFPEVDGVVHTLGTLIEDGRYKQALKNGDILSVMQSVCQSGFSDGNPLKRQTGGEQNRGSYEVMNRDTALRVCEAFIASPPSEASKINIPRPFVYISAEDIFRPVISERYITTKREAERRIEIMMQANPLYRGVYIRPSLVYHPHHRPWTTPAAALLDLSAVVHENMPRGLPTPSSFIRSLGSAFPQTGSDGTRTSPLESIANALTTRPIHVDTVAEAVCAALDPSRGVRGVIGVSAMRELLGWTETRREGGGAPVGLHNS